MSASTGSALARVDEEAAGEDEPADADPSCGVHEGRGAVDDRRTYERILLEHRTRGQVEHGVHAVESALEALRTLEITLDDLDAETGKERTAERTSHQDAGSQPARDELAGELEADETGRAGHEDRLQGRILSAVAPEASLTSV